MKLRCTKNSIRIRIRKSELEELSKKNIISESIDFGNTIFSFSLSISDVPKINAVFEERKINVFLPEVKAMAWIGSDQVGMEHFKPLDNSEELHILIEKDFPCKDREDEDKSDTFWELADGSDDAC